MALVSCIVVTYGRTPTLARTIESLVRHASCEQAIVVVTQPDDLGEREFIDSTWSSVEHVRLDENVGFGPANNLAVSQCDSEFVAFVNPDIVVTEGWQGPLLDALADPLVAIAVPPLLDADGYLAEAGQAIFSDGGTEAMGGERWPGGYDSVMFTRDVDYASAACWVMRRETFLSLGGFDDQYAPAYFEDSDLAMTAWMRGQVTRLVVDRPVVHHHEGASAARVALAEKSRATFEKKWSRELGDQPSRLRFPSQWRSVRDHRAKNRVAFVVRDNIAEPDLERIASDAAVAARRQPRDRVTLVAPQSPSLVRLRRVLRASGLEIVSSDAVDDMTWATDVRGVG